jgi:transcriptional regulator with XRE-family HTH domain
MSARKLNIIGPKLKKLRSDRGLTLADLASKCQLLGWDVSGGTLAKIESCQRSAFDSEMFILKKALKAATDDLFPAKIEKEVLHLCLNKPARR